MASARTSPRANVVVGRVEQALLANPTSPRPSSASCRDPTAAERTAAPFGHTHRPVFSCLVKISGEVGRYEVQVLASGCYVAERRRPGRAIYGCGVATS
jgi:hypothetical protein